MHALSIADEVYLGAVSRSERLSEVERFNRESVMAYLIARGTEAHTADTNGALLVKLEVGTLPGDGRARVVVFFTNGSFDGIIDEFVKMAAGN